jgi:sensor histidine kinase YesM
MNIPLLRNLWPGSRFLKSKSIQTKLLSTYILVTLVPFVTVGVLAYVGSVNAIAEEVKKNNVQLVEEMSRNIDAYFANLTVVSNMYVSKVLNQSINSMESLNRRNLDLTDFDVLANLMQMVEYINNTYDSSDDYLSIRLFSDNGEFLCVAFDLDHYQLYGYNTPEESAWRQRMYGNRSDGLIFDVHPIEENGEFIFAASRSAIDPYTGARYGYISYDLKFSSFANIFQRFEQREGSEVQVIDADGKIVYHTNRALIGKQADAGMLEMVRDTGDSVALQEADRKVIALKKTEQGGLTVVGSVALNVLMSRINLLRNLIFIIGIISLIIVVLLAMGLSFVIAKPIKKLTSLMTEVKTGNLNVTANELTDNGDEIGQLSRSFNSMIHTIQQLIKSNYEAEIRKKDAELKALLMQINPHFLYNTLEVIGGIADSEGVEQISEMTQALSKIMRYNIDLKNEKVRLKDELDNCKNYFYILKCRFEDNLTVIQDIDPEVEPCMIVKQVLQPLIENSIKHGLERKIGKGVIKLSAKYRDGYVTIALEDNGVGFSESKLREFEQYASRLSTSFYHSSASMNLGLKNVYGRLKIVFGDKLRFRIDSEEGEGTRITIGIPAIPYK